MKQIDTTTMSKDDKRAAKVEKSLKDLIRVLDVKARKGCDSTNSWIGFQNGNGEDLGEEIEDLISKAKKALL